MNLKIQNFSKNLRYIRKRMGLTQEKFAEHTGVAYSYIVKLENNEDSPGIDTILKICNSIQVPVEFLLKDDGGRVLKQYYDSYVFKELSKLSDDELDSITDSLTKIMEMTDILRNKNEPR